jgi:uncharacterized membrane protein YphA (DoxX/SURF4 family)
MKVCDQSCNCGGLFESNGKQTKKTMITTAISTSEKTTRVAKTHLLLKLTYSLIPIVAGLDKFTNILTDWEQYLNPALVDLLPVSAQTFMMIVGVIEIVAGVLVFIKTEVGSLIVAAWLVAIALTLVTSWNYVDVAVRDIVMAIGAFVLYLLSHPRNE